MTKDPIQVEKGKKNRASGRAFELKVRKELEREGYIVAKWANNVELPGLEEVDAIHYGNNNWLTRLEPTSGKLIPAKHKFNPFSRAMALGTGFPDFIAYIKLSNNSPYIDQISEQECIRPTYEIIGVEAKSNGTLSRDEKLKCKWLLDNKIFSKILIARKGEKRGEIVYEVFKNESNN